MGQIPFVSLQMFSHHAQAVDEHAPRNRLELYGLLASCCFYKARSIAMRWLSCITALHYRPFIFWRFWMISRNSSVNVAWGAILE